MTKIEHFAGVDDYREYLNAPWRRDGKLYATNGHFMVEIADDGREAAAFDKQPDCAALFAKHLPGEFGAIPELPPAIACKVCEGRGMCYREMCPDCDGDGHFMHGRYEYDCQRCDCEGYFVFATVPAGEKPSRCSACYGLGEEVNREAGTKVGARQYATRLLRVLTALPGVEVSCCATQGNPLWFKFDGGRGLVMPMHD